MKKILYILFGFILATGGIVYAANPVTFPANGGTGWGLPGGIKAHTILIGNGTSPLATATPSTAGFVLTSNGTSADPTFQAATGGSGNSFAWPFTVSPGGVSTSTTLGFLNGFFSTASSTIPIASLHLPGASDGCVNITSGVLGSTGSACGAGGSNSFAFPFTVNTGYNSTTTVIGFNGLFSTASSTFSSSLRLSSLGQGLLYVGSNGLVQTSATSTIATSTPTIGAGLTYSGTFGDVLGGASGSLTLDLTHSNTWTGLQSFNYSSSTIYSSFLTASSTFLNAGNLTIATSSAGCAAFMSTGLLVSTGVGCGSGGGGSGTVSSGLFGQVAWYGANGTTVSGQDNLVISSSSLHYIGVGTTTPYGRLSVNPIAGDTGPAFVIGSSTATDLSVTPFGCQNGGICFGIATTTTLGANPSFVVSNISNATLVGIGTSTPGNDALLGANPLEISGITSAQIGFISASTSASNRVAGFVGTQNSAGSAQGLYLGTASNDKINFITNGTNRIIIDKGGFLGLGTSTPYAGLSIQVSGAGVDAFAVATSSGATIAGYDTDGHRFTSGPTPAVSSCGTGSPTDVGDDQGGTITTGTAATACTITFSKSYRSTPYCNFSDDSSTIPGDISSVSTTQLVFALGAGLTGGHLYYSCAYHK